MGTRTHGQRAAWVIGIALLGTFVAGVRGQQPPEAPPLPDIQALGPQVGAKVPEFSLPDQTGTVRTLQSLMKPKGLMLLFYRSADWCPYCKTQLADLQARLPQLTKQGLGVAAVSYDPVPILADFVKRRGITFPLLSDVGSSTIRRYGIFNTTVPEDNKQSFGIPFPGTFMLNRDGVVTARFFEQAYQERVTVGSMLARLGADVTCRNHRHLAAAGGDLVPDGYDSGGRHALFCGAGREAVSRRPRVRARRRGLHAHRALARTDTGAACARREVTRRPRCTCSSR